MKVIIKMSILVTYPLFLMKGRSLYDEYIVKRMIFYLGWTTAWLFTYNQIECRNNKCLVQCIDQLTVKTVHDITEISNDRTILLIFPLLSSYDCLKTNI